MNITFILVNPSVPENIGASARAIKTMGFTLLRLVNPQNYPDEKAGHVAHGSLDILENTSQHPTLEDALQDIDFSIASSAKKRSVRYDYHHAGNLSAILEQKKRSIKNVAIVFGGEESGLSNEEIAQCDIISFIPMKRKYPSLNLSHSVILYAFLLSSFSIPHVKKMNKAPEGKYRKMINLAETSMDEIRFRKDSNIYPRIFERLALLSDDDINLVLSFLDKLTKKIEQ
ncbi:MAG: tRNA/rRNA methyltransferase [Bacteroidales bacterium]|nr:tRNA/rRNA methyltransferase [Bacteroidota bacterium]MBL6949941.1 tRNA/rRNA methyltransferase [Bacteroidales bacterium]